MFDYISGIISGLILAYLIVVVAGLSGLCFW